MDASICAATVLNLWSKIEQLIDREGIITSFHQKNKRAVSTENSNTGTDAGAAASSAVSYLSLSD
jgi:hypothetical protein